MTLLVPMSTAIGHQGCHALDALLAHGPASSAATHVVAVDNSAVVRHLSQRGAPAQGGRARLDQDAAWLNPEASKSRAPGLQAGAGTRLEDEGVAGLDEDAVAAQLAVVRLPRRPAPVHGVGRAVGHARRLACAPRRHIGPCRHLRPGQPQRPGTRSAAAGAGPRARPRGCRPDVRSHRGQALGAQQAACAPEGKISRLKVTSRPSLPRSTRRTKPCRWLSSGTCAALNAHTPVMHQQA